LRNFDDILTQSYAGIVQIQIDSLTNIEEDVKTPLKVMETPILETSNFILHENQ
jgi:hypothetical protein